MLHTNVALGVNITIDITPDKQQDVYHARVDGDIQALLNKARHITAHDYHNLVVRHQLDHYDNAPYQFIGSCIDNHSRNDFVMYIKHNPNVTTHMQERDIISDFAVIMLYKLTHTLNPQHAVLTNDHTFDPQLHRRTRGLNETTYMFIDTRIEDPETFISRLTIGA